MKKMFLVGLLSLSLLVVSLPASAAAQTVSPSVSVTGDMKEDRQQLKNDRLQLRKDAQDIKNDLKGKGIKLVDAVVTAINGGTLTVSKNSKTYTVNTSASTKCARRFWGTCKLSEIQVNDKVNVWGTWTDSTQTTVQARFIRDLSIQKRSGVFFGTLTSKGTDSFVMQTKNRGNETVTVSSTTKFINRKGQTMTFADVQVGNTVRVRGLWDRTNSTITEVNEVKDFSIPVPATASGTVTPSAAVTTH